MTKIIAALDQGTTSTRCLLFNQAGEIISSCQKEHRQIYPQPGWVEHDPLEILDNSIYVIQEALKEANLGSADLAGLGITNQRETTVVWSKITGQPVYNAIVWQDTRTDQICSKLAGEQGQDRFRSKVGLPLATYFSGPKIIWILENVNGVREKAQKGEILFGTIDSWLVWNLTGAAEKGRHVTDVTNASRTMLMDLKTLEWDKDVLDIFDIPEGMLPEIRSSSEIYGKVEGSLSGLPIAGILGDQHAALFGQTCFDPGQAKNTYGTGCFLLLNSGEEPTLSEHGLLTTLGYKIGEAKPVYALEGSVAITGALVQWLRDNLEMIQESAEVEELASQVEDNGGIYFVPAFSGLYAPYWQSNARGVIAGLTRYITKAHIARAVLEATAFQTKEILDAMEKDTGIKLASLKVDGGMVKNELLMQFQSDILNVPVIRPTITETTALGAAYAAGIAVGVWKNQEDLREYWQEDRVWKPTMEEVERDRLYKGWKKAVKRSFDWVD
ncbi:MAG: glycerol kinase [Chloroflexota bacterium]|nr:MAG: glycerol kinase [Chloroflexota bacterium]HDD61687.1 glycerol kinase [Chloroflexota bacterium]